MAKNTVQSVEPNIADLVNGWLKSYKVDYKLEQESLNTEIDQALNDYFSKNGGKGGNRPDAKLLLQANDGKYYPILIEYKGYKDKLVKLDAEGNVANRNAKNQPDYTNINSYAVNGAVHYSNAVLHYTSYTDVIAIGVTGYKDASGKLKHHYIISFDPKDVPDHGLTVDRAQQLGEEYCKNHFPGHQAIVCTHPDGHNGSGNVHVHIVINSLRIMEVPFMPYMDRPCDTQPGMKHRCTNAAMEYFRSEVMEMCHDAGLYQIDLLNGSKTRVTEREYWAKKKGQIALDPQSCGGSRFDRACICLIKRPLLAVWPITGIFAYQSFCSVLATNRSKSL